MVVVTNLTSSGLRKPPLGGFFISFLSIKENFLQDPWIDHIVHERVVDFLRVMISSLAYLH
jgi:hypothetical protein